MAKWHTLLLFHIRCDNVWYWQKYSVFTVTFVTTLFHRIQMAMTYYGCFSTGAAAGVWLSNASGYPQLLAYWLRVSHMSLQWILEMWAIAQRNGCRAKYRWFPLFNATKLGWRPILECRAVTLPRHDQPLVGRSSLYCGDMWRRYCCLTSFFPSPTELCDGAQMAIFCILYFQRAACSKFQTCILNSH